MEQAHRNAANRKSRPYLRARTSAEGESSLRSGWSHLEDSKVLAMAAAVDEAGGGRCRLLTLE
jgi:hypothetical protein